MIASLMLRAGGFRERVDKVGARVLGEIDDVMAQLSEALGISSSYGATLTGASSSA